MPHCRFALQVLDTGFTNSVLRVSEQPSATIQLILQFHHLLHHKHQGNIIYILDNSFLKGKFTSETIY